MKEKIRKFFRELFCRHIHQILKYNKHRERHYYLCEDCGKNIYWYIGGDGKSKEAI